MCCDAVVSGKSKARRPQSKKRDEQTRCHGISCTRTSDIRRMRGLHLCALDGVRRGNLYLGQCAECRGALCRRGRGGGGLI